MSYEPDRAAARRLMWLRVGAAIAAYVAYRVVAGRDFPAAVAVGVGTLLVGYAAVAFGTGEPTGRARIVHAGQIVVGGSLVALGAILLVT